jgi:hypothetical protein
LAWRERRMDFIPKKSAPKVDEIREGEKAT